MDERLIARFWSRVNKEGPVPAHMPHLGPCWIWTGTRIGDGRAQFRIGKRAVYAHRLAFFIQHGRWPTPCALHACDGGLLGCVRWDHLFEGTKADNTADMLAKGRNRFVPRYGADNSNTKLTSEQVAVIKVRFRAGATLREISETFGISQSTCFQIRSGMTWRWVE